MLEPESSQTDFKTLLSSRIPELHTENTYNVVEIERRDA